MTPEEKIADVIDQQTGKIIVMLGEIGWWLGFIAATLFVLSILLAANIAKATPLLPPLDQPIIIELGDPPLPPPNPNLQHWYTMDVPTDNGVFPMQVFAPRLVAPKASDAVEVHVPEPGTWILVVVIALMGLVFQFVLQIAARVCRIRRQEPKR